MVDYTTSIHNITIGKFYSATTNASTFCLVELYPPLQNKDATLSSTKEYRKSAAMIVPYYYYSFRYIQHIRKYMKTTDVNIMSNLRIPVRLQRLIPHSLSTRISSKHLDYNQECQSESYESQTQD